MSKRSKAIRRRRYHIQRRVCQACGSKGADHYWLPDSDPAVDPPDDVLCAEHAALWYCLGCGNFSAGTEGFDFLHRGYCDNCSFTIRAEEEALEDDNDWDDPCVYYD